MNAEVSKMIKMVSVDGLAPASYNPRKLSDDAQDNLVESLTSLGIVKAIVIRESDKRILAGHQRTKTMRKIGITECPAFCLENVSEYDEARFNQLHNLTEVELAEDQPLLKVNIPKGTVGFTVVQPRDITMSFKGGEGNKALCLSELISKYGQFANAVADSEGNIIISALYAKVIKLMHLPMLVYVLPEGKEKEARHYFSLKYGEFSYDHIKRHTYIQSHAQPTRIIEGEKRITVSTLYEQQLIPNVTKETRILDFGAGCKNYYSYLKAKGYNIDALEFFFCGTTSMQKNIHTEQVERDCKEICEHLKKFGRYDVVLSDHVINSVDSVEAEAAVLRTLSALCKPGGLILWSGNSINKQQAMVMRKESKRKRGVFAFLDENNFTANFTSGVWYFQHYHDLPGIHKCNRDYIGENFRVFEQGKERFLGDELNTGTFDVVAVNECKATRQEMLDAIRFEFTLPLPENKRYELDKYIIPIMEELLPE